MRGFIAKYHAIRHAPKRQLFLFSLFGQSILFALIVALTASQLNQSTFAELSQRKNALFFDGTVKTIDVRNTTNMYGRMVFVRVQCETVDGGETSFKVTTTTSRIRGIEIGQRVDVVQSGRKLAARQIPPIEFPFGLMIVLATLWISVTSGIAAMLWYLEIKKNRDSAAMQLDAN